MLLARTPCWLPASRLETMPEWFSAAPWTSSATPSSTLLCRRPHLDPSGKYQCSPHLARSQDRFFFSLWISTCFILFCFVLLLAWSNNHCCVNSCQAWEDGQHGAGRGSVPLGVQGGRSPEGWRCYTSPRRRVRPPCGVHHHRPCGKLWAEAHGNAFASAPVVGCSPTLTRTFLNTGVQRRHRDAVWGPLGSLWRRRHSAGVCEDRSIR